MKTTPQTHAHDRHSRFCGNDGRAFDATEDSTGHFDERTTSAIEAVDIIGIEPPMFIAASRNQGTGA